MIATMTGAVAQRRGHVVDRGLDEVGLAEEDARLAHAGRQGLLQVDERRLDLAR
jgi:hypothetical protein